MTLLHDVQPVLTGSSVAAVEPVVAVAAGWSPLLPGRNSLPAAEGILPRETAPAPAADIP